MAVSGSKLIDIIYGLGSVNQDSAMAIVRAYSNRAYHNADHVLAMLDYAGKRIDDDELFWAIIFHDVVYIPGGNCNEELSALKAREFLDLEEPKMQKVEALIMATKTHPTRPWAEWNEAKSAIVDADLIGFVVDWKENSAKVRQEFRHISDEQFGAGRCDFLRAFAERHPFFCDPETERLHGDTARGNIKAEIEFYSVCD